MGRTLYLAAHAAAFSLRSGLACAGIAAAAAGCGEPATAAPAAGVAVVELFTSEGCSSCPPADAVLSRIAGEASAAGQPVYALSFHVDYWDRLGWKDPWSEAAWSARQQAYGARFGAGMYTPQIVVNGREELLGSDERAARAAINRALGAPAAVGVRVAGVESAGGEARVKVGVEGDVRGAVLNVAAVSDGRSSEVTRGENRGRTLRHDRVVLAMQSAAIDGAGERVVTVPAEAGASGVVAWVQRRSDLAILGAGAADLP